MVFQKQKYLGCFIISFYTNKWGRNINGKRYPTLWKGETCIVCVGGSQPATQENCQCGWRELGRASSSSRQVDHSGAAVWLHRLRCRVCWRWGPMPSLIHWLFMPSFPALIPGVWWVLREWAQIPMIRHEMGGFEDLHQINHRMGITVSHRLLLHPSLWLPLKLQNPRIVQDPEVFRLFTGFKFPINMRSLEVGLHVQFQWLFLPKNIQLQKSWPYETATEKNKNMFPSWCIEHSSLSALFLEVANHLKWIFWAKIHF